MKLSSKINLAYLQCGSCLIANFMMGGCGSKSSGDDTVAFEEGSNLDGYATVAISEPKAAATSDAAKANCAAEGAVAGTVYRADDSKELTLCTGSEQVTRYLSLTTTPFNTAPSEATIYAALFTFKDDVFENSQDPAARNNFALKLGSNATYLSEACLTSFKDGATGARTASKSASATAAEAFSREDKDLPGCTGVYFVDKGDPTKAYIELNGTKKAGVVLTKVQ